MAAKDYARFLPASIGSVLAQSFTDWELIIVDDGSTDNTPAVVRQYLADPRVRYFRADRLGQTRAKSLGVHFSRGRFVAFLDADDVWLPTKLEKQVALFEEHPEVAVVFSRRSLIDEKGNSIPSPPFSPPLRGSLLPDLFVQNFVCFSSAIVRREALSRVGVFDSQWGLAIDYDLWLRIAKHYPFEFVDEVLVKYRTGHGNLSKKLCDRVETALSIMHRAERRLGIANDVPPAAIAEAYGSTCRTIGFVLRASEPLTAARWYLRALRRPVRSLASARGLLACMLRWASGRRATPSPENATANR